MAFFKKDLFKENKELDGKFKKKKVVTYAEYTPPPPKEKKYVPGDLNYKNHEPGSIEWMIIWRNHPELQDEMLKWKTKNVFILCPQRQQRIALEVCKREAERNGCSCD